MTSSSCCWVKKTINGPVPAPRHYQAYLNGIVNHDLRICILDYWYSLSDSKNQKGVHQEGENCVFLRQGHAAAVVDKKAYIFGGSSGSWFGGEHSESTSDPVYLNDLFVLKIGIQVTWERLQQLGDIPCVRDGHTLSAVGTVLYLFGGSNYPESDECLDGLYAYDIGTLSWELCPTQGCQPKALGHTTAVVGDTLYIFGGIYHGNATNTLYMLNTAKLKWKKLQCSGEGPDRRHGHIAVMIYGQLIIFGGMDDQKDFDDVCILQTRAALKYLPQEMTGNGGSDMLGPPTSYDLSIQVPAPYRPVIPAVTEPAKPPEFDDVKASFTKRVEEIFEDLSNKYAEELEDMINKHRVENEEWINARKQELEEERHRLELEKGQLVEERERLRKEKIEFGEKIEAIEKLGGGANHLLNGVS
ncbi:hypothetical protein pdam_00015089 [Pocillopora damicornis]|uniref:Uncharacterized protein n=1 Tax=Pocillopora damicornis TaxID=46731 RepID=A0A3M6UMJ3_POCDA|nr:hypothetical protein pdam_00015089 [Pocillopora damicornis]